MEELRAEGFCIGPNKAFHFARDMRHVRMMFCSEMENELAHSMLINPVDDLQIAVDQALADTKPGE